MAHKIIADPMPDSENVGEFLKNKEHACRIFSTMWFALGGRRRAKTARPKIDDVFEFQKIEVADAKRKWLADLISAYNETTNDVNKTVELVYTAQDFLAIAVGLLLVIALSGVFAIILHSP